MSQPGAIADLIDDAVRATTSSTTHVATNTGAVCRRVGCSPCLDLIGIFAFGISCAPMAIRRDFDVVGIAILAVVTALGGGSLA